MTIRPQLWISIAIVASLCGVLLLATGRSAAQPHTDRAAVMMILDQRGVMYADVQVRAGDPSVPQDHFASVAAVVVEAEPPAYGKIECLSSAGDCVLWIEALGLHQVPLPTPAATLPWVEWIKRHLHAVEASLQAWLARGFQKRGLIRERDVQTHRQALGELAGGPALVGLDLLDGGRDTVDLQRQPIERQIERAAPPQRLAKRGSTVHRVLSQVVPVFVHILVPETGAPSSGVRGVIRPRNVDEL